jgi:O-antigen/teichoic acid export membrane protein
MLVLGLTTATVLGLSAPVWITVLFPELPDPTRATTTLRILAAALPLSFLTGVLIPYHLARGHDLPILLISAIGLTLMLGGFLVFPHPSPQTLAWVLVAVEAWMLLGSWLIPRPSLPFEIRTLDG